MLGQGLVIFQKKCAYRTESDKKECSPPNQPRVETDHPRTIAERSPIKHAFNNVKCPTLYECIEIQHNSESKPPQNKQCRENKLQEIGRAQSELQSLMRISSAVFCLKKKTT